MANTTLVLETCPASVEASLILWIIVVIALFFIMIGIFTRIGFIGFFGAIMLMILSWYISPCQQMYAYALALLSIVLIIWFALISPKAHT